MTLLELMAIPTISGLKLISGNLGAHKNISSVTIVDTPDGFAWLTGGEIVITTGYALKGNDDALCDFIKILANKGATGLVIKVNRYIVTIPKSAMAIADKLNFPLVTCPEEYAFSEIINPVIASIVDSQSQRLRQSAKIHKKFLELAINNNSIPEILSALSSLVKRDTAFIDTYFNECYFSDATSKMAVEIKKNGDFRELNPQIFLNYDTYNVSNKNKEFGYIISERMDAVPISEENFEESLLLTAYEYASIVLILRMQMRISNHLVDEKYKNSFLEDLLLHNIKTESEIHNRGQLYNWDFTKGGQVLLFDINNIKKYYISDLDPKTNAKLEEYIHNIFEVTIGAMHAFFPTEKHYRLSDIIAFIISTPLEERCGMQAKFEESFNKIQQQIVGEIPFTLTLGIGEYYSNIMDIHKSYKEAKTSIEIGYQLQKFDCILLYKNMEVYKLLGEVSGSKEGDEFCAKYIKPLVDYDKVHHSELCKTLQAITKCGWNLKQAAAELYIHYNSAKYRFQKICDVLELDLREHDLQLVVEIAMKIYFINNLKL
ncbi:MAG: PucR family transcriptional regulator ligand-binding domain-containing protein [Oscillospiraceae bacterium]